MSRISRRDFFKAGAAAGMAAALPTTSAQGKPPATPAGGVAPDLVFVNGKIHTMDDTASVVSAVAIRDGRFVAVGDAANPGPGVKVINLRGRTVVPGLLESHTHFVSLANRPGYHVAGLELAHSIAEVQEMLAERRARGDVPEGAFITAMGGWHPRQWFGPGEMLRLPTLAELDAAVPDRPVMLYQGGSGPGVTNTLGKAFFEHPDISPPVLVGANGELANVMGVNHANRALVRAALRNHRAQRVRRADQCRPADQPAGSAPRLHARQRLVPESRERPRLHRGRQARRSLRARPRLLQRERRGDARDARSAHRGRRQDRARRGRLVKAGTGRQAAGAPP